MKIYILILVTFLFAINSYSQINELGLHVGGSNYIGDIGNESYISPNNLSIGAIYKWNMNPRVTLRGSFSYIKISADDADSSNEVREARNFSFKNAIKELAVGVEFNYYKYTLTRREFASTPYLILELAAFNYNTADDKAANTPTTINTTSKTGFTVPFGIGYKTRLAHNIGIGFEIKARYSFVDDLDYFIEGVDYNNATIEQINFGNPDSDDWYITTGINIVFGFGRKGCYSGAF